MLLRKMLGRKWLMTTLLVLAGIALCVRLGIWQLDRLDQRRAFNAQFESMRALPPLDLNDDGLDAIADSEWRAALVRGTYDFANQVALRNQYYDSQYGYHLMTPLLFESSSSSPPSTTKAVLVDRGWIPADGNSASAAWRKYDAPGDSEIAGQIRLGQSKPPFGGVADMLPTSGARLEVWNNADVAGIAEQLPYAVLPVYIQLKEDPQDVEPPIPFQPEIELTEGPHLGYAFQWFTFSTILLIGYPFYLRKQESKG